MAELEKFAVLVAEDLERVEAKVDKVKHANLSAGTGPPVDDPSIPVGWKYLDTSTLEVWEKEA